MRRAGKVIDDGTVTRLAEDTFRWTAADPSLRWFTQNAIGIDVTIEDVSEQIAALALQGPTSAAARRGRRRRHPGLKYFRMTRGTIAGVPVDISRTGYTGDLGYEIWMPWDRAVDVWDALMTGGRPFDIHPAGMLALDVARVEAGLLLIDVDFFSSKKALIGPRDTRRSIWASAALCSSTAVRSSAVPRCSTNSAAAGPADRRPGDRAGRQSRRCTTRSALRRRLPQPPRGTAVPVYAAAAARSAARRPLLVAGAEEADRAGDRRRRTRRRHGARGRGHRRSRPPPRPGDGRPDAVLQPRPKDGADGVARHVSAMRRKVGRGWGRIAAGRSAAEAELCTHMQAYLDGDIEAFDALYAAFAGRLRGYLLSQCRDATLADDLLQETFMQIHRSRRTYQPASGDAVGVRDRAARLPDEAAQHGPAGAVRGTAGRRRAIGRCAA